MSLKEIQKERHEILSSVEAKLLSGIESTQISLFSSLLKLVRKLAQTEGRLKREPINNKLLASLTKRVLRTIRESTLQKRIDLFLPNFERLEKLSDLTYQDLLDKRFTKRMKSEIKVFRKIQINKITTAVLGEASLNSNIINPIRDIIFNGIASRSRIEDVENALRAFVKGSPASGAGQLKKYVRQVATDAINQHEGLVNDVVRDAYQLDGFIYTGGLVRASRSNCIDLVNGGGIFSDLAVRAGVYRVEDIPKILDRARKGKGSGFNPSVTPESFAQYRMGYNCNHTVTYIPLFDEKVQSRLINAID